MPGKRQHYISKFLLRRFAIDPADKRSLIFKLDLRTGKPGKVNPANEAVRRHYYRIEHENGEVDDTADLLLDRFEDEAAKVIRRLVADTQFRPADIDMFWLANFIVSLKLRTPEGREQLHEMDVRMAEVLAEVRLSNPEQVPDSVTDDEREELLRDLLDGRLVFESTPSREVCLMFLGLQHTADFIYSKMRWTLLCAPAERQFVLSDHPVTHFDPTPKTPEAGAAYASSSNAKTVIPLDPRVALLLEPDDSGGWHRKSVEAADVDEINLLIYAQAREAIYGSSQAVVTDVRRLAKRDPATVGRFRLKPPRLWIATVDADDDGGGVHEYTSTYKGKTARADLYVSPEGAREARRHAWP